ncbi:hypothetical protein IV01_18340 [Pseudomonas syringae]|uniref:Uncharacterized protein n=1 Tax=Pseudomonas syringae TaxID=317 RepID=A0A085VEJ7_PSESX|nr:hypothetical protein IV01_18340 [Pseudomonas syringae]
MQCYSGLFKVNVQSVHLFSIFCSLMFSNECKKTWFLARKALVWALAGFGMIVAIWKKHLRTP